jgi:enterochelin esterase family protein
MFGFALRSPEVAPDGRVTFRLRAPNAKEVFVTGIGQQRLAMTRNEQGVWSVTTEPLQPDVYSYSFSVDGATFNDPGNALFKTAYNGGGQSLVHVPGAVSWEPAAGVARGAVTRHFYKSDVVGDDRDFYVYTPAGYDPKRKEPYPVLYLLHGLGDDASSWVATGAANVILDNLIAQGKAKPMVMVNPLGYGTAGGGMGGPDMIAQFAKTILQEVMPRVEKAYNVSKDRNQRAVAGLSMGGAEAVYTGLNNLDRFAWVASFSGAYVMWPGAGRGGPGAAAGAGRGAAPAAAANPAGGRGGRGQTLDPAIFPKDFPTLDAKANSRLKLLWIGCGLNDSLLGVNRQFEEWLKSKDVKFTQVETPEFAHEWGLWRRYVAIVAPMLFQEKGK